MYMLKKKILIKIPFDQAHIQKSLRGWGGGVGGRERILVGFFKNIILGGGDPLHIFESFVM